MTLTADPDTITHHHPACQDTHDPGEYTCPGPVLAATDAVVTLHPTGAHTVTTHLHEVYTLAGHEARLLAELAHVRRLRADAGAHQ